MTDFYTGHFFGELKGEDYRRILVPLVNSEVLNVEALRERPRATVPEFKQFSKSGSEHFYFGGDERQFLSHVQICCSEKIFARVMLFVVRSKETEDIPLLHAFYPIEEPGDLDYAGIIAGRILRIAQDTFVRIGSRAWSKERYFNTFSRGEYSGWTKFLFPAQSLIYTPFGEADEYVMIHAPSYEEAVRVFRNTLYYKKEPVRSKVLLSAAGEAIPVNCDDILSYFSC